jgi:DNA-binding response OmpR family regulator
VTTSERRTSQCRDRRAAPRGGGRRPYDRPGRHPSLLVADSYDGARIPCARYLDHFGFHVDQAADGRDALAVLESRLPHVVLVEYSLPKVSATGLAEWLEKDDRTRRVPLILMLSDFDSDAPRSLPHSAAVLVKPFPLSTMLQEVRRALRLQPVAV